MTNNLGMMKQETPETEIKKVNEIEKHTNKSLKSHGPLESFAKAN